MRSTKADDPVRLFRDEPRQCAILVGHRVFEQLCRAANARKRVLDLVRQHGRKPRYRAGSTPVHHLPVDLVGHGALLEKERDSARHFGNRVLHECPPCAPLRARGEEMSTRYSLMATRCSRTCSTRAISGLPKGTKSASRLRARMAAPERKKSSASAVDLDHEAILIDHHHRVPQRVQEQTGGAGVHACALTRSVHAARRSSCLRNRSRRRREISR